MTLQWHTMGRSEVFERLKTTKEGLTEEEAAKRLLKYGPNALPQKRATSSVRLFLQQFANPLIAILLIAGAITAGLRQFADTIVIGIAVAINITIGFVQEYKAEHALLALLKVIAEETMVIRAAHHRRIPREQVVPGDIIVLASGDRIPADIRLLEADDLEVNEAILTGESLPQHKTVARTEDHRRLGEITNVVYAGTVVTRGGGKGVAVATGLTTEVGKIAKVLEGDDHEHTPLQEKLQRFSRSLSLVVVALAAIVFFLGTATARSPVEMFTIAVALAVAAIPEGLVVGVTAILAIGMHHLVQQNALVRRLLAAETLGSTTVICTDKTGTLTEGEMRLIRIVTLDHEHDCTKSERMSDAARHAMTIGVLVAGSIIDEREGAIRVFGSPTERSITLGGLTLGVKRSILTTQQRIIDTMPFNSERKMAAVLHEPRTKGRTLSVMGAPDRLLPLSTHVLRSGRRQKMNAQFTTTLETTLRTLGEHGWRIVGVAERSFPNTATHIDALPEALTGLTFVGFLVLVDPLRQGVVEMIQRAHGAGITTVMVTGDHRATATHIAKELGLPHEPHNVLTGEMVEKFADHELAERVAHVSVYARVVPSEKVAIVEAWQKRGAVVAMTGDGVNDAPALKRADIGVAVGTATDVAKEAADLVILDNNFGTIVRAVEEGRVIMDNVRKLILYLLSDSFSEIILIAGALFLGWPLPLLAVQILWINLVTDGFPNLALTVDPGEHEVMREKPIPRGAPLLDIERKLLIVLISVFTGLVNLGLFYAVWQMTGDHESARNLVFVSLGLDSLLYVFSCRTLRRPLWRSSLTSNSLLLIAVAGGFALQVVALYVRFLQRLLSTRPLALLEWGIIVIISLVVVGLIEVVKGVFIFQKNHRHQ